MKKLWLLLLVFVIIGGAVASLHFQASAADDYNGLKVKGRFLYDQNGDKLILVGVNKMVIWMDNDGLPSYEEIAKTGANCVRIVWTSDGSAKQLDTAIYNCRANNMIPMIEHHGATGAWSSLDTVVSYWTRSDVVEVLKKHQNYLLLNIANECGDSSVTASDFRTKYISVVKTLREAGLHMPLVIDAPSYGQNIDILQSEGPSIFSADPDQNVMFSIHMWWPKMWGGTDEKVINEVAESVQLGLPLIVGEFGGLWEESDGGQIPYQTILEQCTKNEIGWLAWEWGPGNNPQTFLDMTDDSTYATLHEWGLDVAVTNTYSIKNTAVRPAWLQEALPPLPTPTPLPAGNLAAGKTVTVSSVEGTAYPGSNAVDGNLSTRWASVSGSDPQTLTVDLGQVYDFNRILLCWENAYGTQYKIQTSNDGETWTDIYTEYSGNGETDDLTVKGSGRYVRLYGMQRYNYAWGYSLWEIGIYSADIVPTASATQSPIPTPTPTRIVTPPPTQTPSPTPSPSVAVSPSQTPSSGTGCAVSYTMNDWGTGATVSITVKNNGTSAITDWELAFSFAGNQKITNIWCGEYTQSGTSVTISNEPYNATIPAGGSVSFGLNLSYSGSNPKPTSFTLNGTTCTTY